MARVVIIGGGAAGLAAAAFCGRAGDRVVLLERATRFGGRAASDLLGGALLNQGPHALYREGAAMRVLRELGVLFRGVVPDTRHFFFEHDDRLSTLPAGAVSLWSTEALTFTGKLQFAKTLFSLSESLAKKYDFVTVRDWLSTIPDPTARRALSALVRVSTYAADHDRLSAGAAIRQVRHATKYGVEYLHGGWQTIVDGLKTTALAAGVDLRNNMTVEELRRADQYYEVVCNGETFAADAVVLAVGPRACATLAPFSRALSLAVADLVPVRAACLDVVLSSLPTPTLFTLGLDAPTYLSVHSAFADLGPKDACVVHVAKYLVDADEDTRAELERVLSLAHPGWETRVMHTRYLPKMTVSHALPLASLGGRRPGVSLPDAPGLSLAGDWVGTEGMLLDAALASAREAARAITHERRVA